MGRVLAKRALHPHPATTGLPFNIGVKLTAVADRALLIDYVVIGDVAQLKIPAPTMAERADELWRTTCFEAFIRVDGSDSYSEYNFSPSGDWAIYYFEAYREGMMPSHDRRIIRSWTEQSSARLAQSVLIELERPILESPIALALSAVIEETDGTKSYWALAHPPGKPDFHHPDCFQLTLGAPDGV